MQSETKEWETPRSYTSFCFSDGKGDMNELVAEMVRIVLGLEGVVKDDVPQSFLSYQKQLAPAARHGDRNAQSAPFASLSLHFNLNNDHYP